jgi:hypothetical protein
MNESDGDIDATKCSMSPGIQCAKTADPRGSSTPWPVLRNELVPKVYKLETIQDFEFKYWLFIDHNLLYVSCLAHQNGRVERQAAECFARFIHFLLARTSYSQVFYSEKGVLAANELQIKPTLCGASVMHAVHRAAVPILLPYVHIADEPNLAQVISWHLSLGCLSGQESSIESGMVVVASEQKAIRSKNLLAYAISEPRQQRVNGQLKETFGTIGLVPKPISDQFTSIATQCAPAFASSDFVVGNSHTNASAKWRGTANYQKCLKALKPRFYDFIKAADIPNQ